MAEQFTVVNPPPGLANVRIDGGGPIEAPLRGQLLREAERLTCGDRNHSYGEPVANMEHIAAIFNAITGQDLSAKEVALLHVATKLARLRTTPTHRDSHVDMMAYAGIAYECVIAESTVDES